MFFIWDTHVICSMGVYLITGIQTEVLGKFKSLSKFAVEKQNLLFNKGQSWEVEVNTRGEKTGKWSMLTRV